MVKVMLNKNSYYKSSDLLNEEYTSRMNSYFNPYGYNLESNLKDNVNQDIVKMRSKRHEGKINNKK